MILIQFLKIYLDFYNIELERTVRYASFLLAPAEGFDFRPRFFFALWAKKELFMLIVLILGHFWCSVVTSVTLSSNLNNLKNQTKKSLKNLKISTTKKSLNLQNSKQKSLFFFFFF